MSATDGDVIDQVEEHRFLHVEGGIEAQLVYRTDDGTLELVHTEVPDELGGRGVAGGLVRAAVERAARTGETVKPTCPYVRSWLQKHPDEVATITVEWDDQPPQ